MSAEAPKLTALTVEQVARLLSAAGERRLTEEMVRADLDAGAPANADGTIHLVHYAAWLARQAAGGQEGRDAG
jgi:hypothetical protein